MEQVSDCGKQETLSGSKLCGAETGVVFYLNYRIVSAHEYWGDPLANAASPMRLETGNPEHIDNIR